MPPVKHELYNWCASQRYKRRNTEKSRAAIKQGEVAFKFEKMLSDYQIEKLDEIGFDWKGSDSREGIKEED